MISNQRGFSMLELMIGLLIMTILIVAVVSVGSSSVKKYRDFGVLKDLKVYVNAAEIYMMDESGKGITESGFNKYLEGSYKFVNGMSIKKNPWKNPYILYQIHDSSYDNSGKILVYSVVDEVVEIFPGYFHNDLDGVVYYFRGEVASCLSSSPAVSQEELQEVFILFGNQSEYFVCGDTPVYNK